MGLGFGSIISQEHQKIDSLSVFYRFGQWCAEDQESPSNYKEPQNLAETIEEFVILRSVKGADIFMFIDKNVTEYAFWKGSSLSFPLFEFVLRLK